MSEGIRECKLVFKNGSKCGVYVTLHVLKEQAGGFIGNYVKSFMVTNTISFIKREKGFEKKEIKSNEIVTLRDEHPQQILNRIGRTVLVNDVYTLPMKWCLKGIYHDSGKVPEDDEVYTSPVYNMSKEVQKGIEHIKGRGNWRETKHYDVLFSLSSKYRIVINYSNYKRLREYLENDNSLYMFMGYDELLHEWVNNEDLDVEKVINSLEGTRVRNNGYYQIKLYSYFRTSLTNDRDLWLNDYYVAHGLDSEKKNSVQLLRRYGVVNSELLDCYIVINEKSKEWLKKKLLGEKVNETKLTMGISGGYELNHAVSKLIDKKEILDEYLGLAKESIFIGKDINQIRKRIEKLSENIQNDKIVLSAEMIKKLRREKGKWYLMNKKELTVIKIIFNRDMQIKDIELQYENNSEYSSPMISYDWDSEIKQYWF